VRDGTGLVTCTPHAAYVDIAEVPERVHELQVAQVQAGIDLEVRPGAELRGTTSLSGAESRPSCRARRPGWLRSRRRCPALARPKASLIAPANCASAASGADRPSRALARFRARPGRGGRRPPATGCRSTRPRSPATTAPRGRAALDLVATAARRSSPPTLTSPGPAPRGSAKPSRSCAARACRRGGRGARARPRALLEDGFAPGGWPPEPNWLAARRRGRGARATAACAPRGSRCRARRAKSGRRS
jgi:hypothetical protein